MIHFAISEEKKKKSHVLKITWKHDEHHLPEVRYFIFPAKSHFWDREDPFGNFSKCFKSGRWNIQLRKQICLLVETYKHPATRNKNKQLPSSAARAEEVTLAVGLSSAGCAGVQGRREKQPGEKYTGHPSWTHHYHWLTGNCATPAEWLTYPLT